MLIDLFMKFLFHIIIFFNLDLYDDLEEEEMVSIEECEVDHNELGSDKYIPEPAG